MVGITKIYRKLFNPRAKFLLMKCDSLLSTNWLFNDLPFFLEYFYISFSHIGKENILPYWFWKKSTYNKGLYSGSLSTSVPKLSEKIKYATLCKVGHSLRHTSWISAVREWLIWHLTNTNTFCFIIFFLTIHTSSKFVLKGNTKSPWN